MNKKDKKKMNPLICFFYLMITHAVEFSCPTLSVRESVVPLNCSYVVERQEC